jgi:hypothetical protein
MPIFISMRFEFTIWGRSITLKGIFSVDNMDRIVAYLANPEIGMAGG